MIGGSPMKLTGIKHGNTIELSENPNIPDGTQVAIANLVPG
jgi:hypothetical protein